MSDETDLSELEPLYRQAEERAKAAGLTTEREAGWDDEPWLVVNFPNGRTARAKRFSHDEVSGLLAEDFETIHFLGDFEAVIDIKTGEIEARVGTLNFRPAPIATPWNLPGAEIIQPAKGSDPDKPAPRFRAPRRWRLTVVNGDQVIELSPATERFSRIMTLVPGGARPTTLKLSGFATKSNDDAVKVLSRFGEAFLFDLDVRYGTGLGLMALRARLLARPQKRSSIKPTFPRSHYAAEPLALYNYARSANGVPLLEFLAYYQAVEYFFPVLSRADTVHRLQNALRDPLFDLDSEMAILRLIAIGETSSRSASERDQMRIAVRTSAEVVDLRDFIEGDKRYTDHFCSKNQAIKGVERIQVQSVQTDLRDQVADRMYSIRCRVVHSKQEGGDSGVDLLLPSSREARSLTPDVQLMRLIAQRLIVARAAPAAGGG